MMSKYKSSRELLSECAGACGLPIWAKDILDAPCSGIIDDGPKTKACLIALELRTDERDQITDENNLLRSKIAYVESLLEDGVITLALEAIRAEYVK